jgi:hypothetical protein
VRRILNVSGTIGKEGPGAERRVGALSDGGLSGPPARWVEELSTLARDGFDTFILWPSAGLGEDQVERFAREVAPGVREAVAA